MRDTDIGTPTLCKMVRKGSDALRKIEEIRQLNKQKNDKLKHHQEEEERLQRAEAEVTEHTKLLEQEVISPQNLFAIMNSEDTPQGVLEDMDIDKAIKEQNECSPPPKKEKSGSGKAKAKRTRAQVTPPDPATNSNPHPKTTTANKSALFLDTHVYTYKRTVLKLAILLKSDKAFEEFTQVLMSFITNAQMVDPKFVLNPVNENSSEKNISLTREISPNMTKMGLHIKISGYGNVFLKKKIWANQDNERKSRKVKKDEFRDPMVYFLLVVSSDVKPQEIVEQVTHEWTRLNGTRLQIKDLQSINSETVVTFFKVSTLTPKKVILSKLKHILGAAQSWALSDLLDPLAFDFIGNEGVGIGENLPLMNLQIQVVMLRGSQVTALNWLGHHTQHARKSWHLKVDSRHAVKMKGLILCAKELSCVEEIWGDHAHLSEITDSNLTFNEPKRQVKVAQTHTNYQLSMTIKELKGVTNLDKKISWKHPTKDKSYNFSLRMILLYYLKMQDGHPMVDKVHQEDLCKTTHIIIPQAEEAEQMVGMMNKNLADFLHHMLLELDFNEEVIKLLIKKSREQSLMNKIWSCKWNSKTRTLTTPADVKHEREVRAFESAAWFKEEFGILKRGTKAHQRPPPEELFNLDSFASVKTIHDRHQTTSILKRLSYPVTDGKDAVNLTQDDSGDTASHSSSSSSGLPGRDKDNGSAEGPRSESSLMDEEEESVADSG